MTRLLYGPYIAPAVRPGDTLFDERRGMVVVGGYTDAPIPWPRARKTGKPSLILCGDLTEAVRSESVKAICHHFGVGVVTVWAWRKALCVGRMTDGTKELYRDIMPDKLPPDVIAKGRESAASPESRAKTSKAKKGRPMHPATQAALLVAVKRPKSEEWKKAASERMREQWRTGKRRNKSG